MSEDSCYFNGDLLPRGEVPISIDDGGLLRGEGVFETLLYAGGRAHDVPAHLDRLLGALDTLGWAIPEGRAELAAAVESLAARAGAGSEKATARLRMTITTGPPGGPCTRLITADPYEPPARKTYRAGVTVVTERDLRLDSRRPLRAIKSISYLMYRLIDDRARRVGAFDAVALNEHQRLVEGGRTNVVLLLDGEWVTPPIEDGCLPGTVRRRLLETGEVRERPIEVREISAARSGALTNSLIGVLPIGRWDGRPLRVGRRVNDLGLLVANPWRGE